MMIPHDLDNDFKIESVSDITGKWYVQGYGHCSTILLYDSTSGWVIEGSITIKLKRDT